MWKKILVGLIVGFISGMFASGGGLLLIPAYIHFFNSSEKEARATAIFCILPMVLVTAIFYGTGNYINWKTGMLCSSANSFTGGATSLYPLPFGLSGWVNTPTILCPVSMSFCKDACANSGVPINTILMQTLLWVVFVC